MFKPIIVSFWLIISNFSWSTCFTTFIKRVCLFCFALSLYGAIMSNCKTHLYWACLIKFSIYQVNTRTTKLTETGTEHSPRARATPAEQQTQTLLSVPRKKRKRRGWGRRPFWKRRRKIKRRRPKLANFSRIFLFRTFTLWILTRHPTVCSECEADNVIHATHPKPLRSEKLMSNYPHLH